MNYKYFRKAYKGENWPESLFLFRDGRMLWINDYIALRKAGQSVFVKYMLPKSSRARIYKEWQGEIRRFTVMERKIAKTDLSVLTDTQLINLWQDFHAIYLKFWIPGTVPELGNYGSDKLLEQKLSKHLADKNQLVSALEILTAPVKVSFYQQEEIDLTGAGDLNKHQKKYFWLKNSYAGVSCQTKDFFTKRKAELNSHIAEEIRHKINEAKKGKLQIQHQLRLSPEIMNIAEAISDGIAWQDERKKHIFIALHYQNAMVAEIARRTKYPQDDLLNCATWEMPEVTRRKIASAELTKRRQGFGVNFYKWCKFLDSKSAKYYWELYAGRQIKTNTKEVTGLVVSRGRGELVRGRVRILLNPEQADTFKNGEVLIAPMTSPEYIFAMKKAAAIVTDAGGLTSHAAIVSRELGIPCIVGTKQATRVFKDGDKVEVDAVLGTVRRV